MTIERPMSPPAGQSNVVQFSAFAAVAAAQRQAADGAKVERGAFARNREAERRERELLTPPATDTCRNQRLRLSRRDVWWAAGRLTAYWRARMDWHNALSSAQTHGIADANSYPKCDDDRQALVDLWRDALVKQMLTPAPDVAAIAWKRAQLRAENYRYSGVKPERLQSAIDADVEWLEAHPTRKSIAASRQSTKHREKE
jgi:hypothetical protein